METTDRVDGIVGEHLVLSDEGAVDVREKQANRFGAGLLIRGGRDGSMVAVRTSCFL
jgi:hypothetical protein